MSNLIKPIPVVVKVHSFARDIGKYSWKPFSVCWDCVMKYMPEHPGNDIEYRPSHPNEGVCEICHGMTVPAIAKLLNTEISDTAYFLLTNPDKIQTYGGKTFVVNNLVKSHLVSLLLPEQRIAYLKAKDNHNG